VVDEGDRKQAINEMWSAAAAYANSGNYEAAIIPLTTAFQMAGGMSPIDSLLTTALAVDLALVYARQGARVSAEGALSNARARLPRSGGGDAAALLNDGAEHVMATLRDLPHGLPPLRMTPRPDETTEQITAETAERIKDYLTRDEN
jgi:hypothetical protein